MANTPIEAVYVAMKAQYQPGIPVRYPYVFDDQNLPYIYMYEVDDPREKGFLCDDSGGISRITVGYMTTTFEDAVDQLETIITFVEGLFGEYSPVEIWKVQVESVRDLTGIEQSAQFVYRREFDILISWGK